MGLTLKAWRCACQRNAFYQNDYSKTDPLPCNQSQFLPWNTNLTQSTEKSLMNRPQAEPCRTIDVQLLYTILSGYVSLLVCALTTPTDLVICTVSGLYITRYNLFSCTTACSSLLQPHNVWETVALLLTSPFKIFFFFLESTLGPLSFHVNFRMSPNIPKTQIRLY